MTAVPESEVRSASSKSTRSLWATRLAALVTSPIRVPRRDLFEKRRERADRHQPDDDAHGHRKPDIARSRQRPDEKDPEERSHDSYRHHRQSQLGGDAPLF